MRKLGVSFIIVMQSMRSSSHEMRFITPSSQNYAKIQHNIEKPALQDAHKEKDMIPAILSFLRRWRSVHKGSSFPARSLKTYLLVVACSFLCLSLSASNFSFALLRSSMFTLKSPSSNMTKRSHLRENLRNSISSCLINSRYSESI